MKCSYCKTADAVIKFATGKWSCDSNIQRCPAIKKAKSESMLARNFHSKKQTLERQLRKGIYRCSYCGAVAVTKNINNMFCCKKLAYDCPEYSNFLSVIKKMNYEENPDLRIKMSKAMIEAQNRPDVQDKKSQSMIHLHNDDCEPCREFQKNYKEAHKKRRTENYDRNQRYRGGVSNE